MASRSAAVTRFDEVDGTANRSTSRPPKPLPPVVDIVARPLLLTIIWAYLITSGFTPAAAEFDIISARFTPNGDLEVIYESDTGGKFTLLHGDSLDAITVPLASSPGQGGTALFLLPFSLESQTGFFRIEREENVVTPTFVSAPTDGTTLSFEGSFLDSGAAEWNEHRVEEGDPVSGPPLTPAERESLSKIFTEARRNTPGFSGYDGRATLPSDGASFLKFLAQFDDVYRASLSTNGLEAFEASVPRFVSELVAKGFAGTVFDPIPLVLRYSRSMTPYRKVRLLSELARNLPQARAQMLAELWRLAILERETAGWGYSGHTLPSPVGIFEPVLSILDADSNLDERRDARGRMPFSSEFREIAVALIASEENRDARLTLVEYIINLSVVAVPLGGISTHILGGEVGGVAFPALVQPEFWFSDSGAIREVRNFTVIFRNLADLDLRLTDVERRVEVLEDRVQALEHWAAVTDTTLLVLRQAVTNLEGRVTSLEQWQETVESRLAEIELRIDLIETLGVPFTGVRLPKKEDHDQDQIDDRVERLLIDAFSPVIMIDDDWRPPVSAEWFVQHSYLRGPGEDPDGVTAPVRAEWTRRRNVWKNNPYLFIPEYERLVAEAQRVFPNTGPGSWRLQLDRNAFRDGQSDIGDQMTWERAKREGNVGMYAHVVRGDNDSTGRFGGEYIIQYFTLLTWNETAYSFGIGNHEGDWTCIMLFIDLPEYAPQAPEDVLLSPNGFRQVQQILEQSARTDRVIMARVCNHGRYIDARGDKLDTTDIGDELGSLRGGRKPRFWMEGGTHELWPNSGGRGYSGWPGMSASNSQIPALWKALSPLDSPLDPLLSENKPNFRDGRVFDGNGFWVFGYATKFRPGWILSSHGYRISFDFGGGEEWDDLNEHKVVRGHRGSKGAYITRSIPNLGEISRPDGAIRESSQAAELVLRYRGFWGGWWKGSESPEGPWKDEMWIGDDLNRRDERKAAQIDSDIRRPKP